MHSILSDSHAYILEKEKKKEQAQQPPSLHGRSDTPNLTFGKKRGEPIVFLHETSDKPNSGTKIKPGSLLSCTPNSGKRKKKRMSLALCGRGRKNKAKLKKNL